MWRSVFRFRRRGPANAQHCDCTQLRPRKRAAWTPATEILTSVSRSRTFWSLVPRNGSFASLEDDDGASLEDETDRRVSYAAVGTGPHEERENSQTRASMRWRVISPVFG